MKKHIRDIRLFNNAGISFPACQANAKLLDMDKGAWPTTSAKDATCAHCKVAFKRIYPWASDYGSSDPSDMQVDRYEGKP
jgi:hypothetical protein